MKELPWKMLMSLLLLQFREVSSYHQHCGCNSWLDNNILPYKPTSKPNIIIAKHTSTICNDIKLKSLDTTNDTEETIKFDADSTHSCVDSSVFGNLKGMIDDLLPGTYHEMEQRHSETTTGKATEIGEGLAAFALKDNDG